MSIVKDENSNKEDYLFQDNKKTKTGASIIIAALIILVVAVLLSGFYFEWY